jgi:hypothetical protein
MGEVVDPEALGEHDPDATFYGVALLCSAVFTHLHRPSHIS